MEREREGGREEIDAQRRGRSGIWLPGDKHGDETWVKTTIRQQRGHRLGWGYVGSYLFTVTLLPLQLLPCDW